MASECTIEAGDRSDGPPEVEGTQGHARAPPTLEHPKLVGRFDGRGIEREHATQQRGPFASRTEGRSFWRHVKWSPDGTHFLAQSDSHHLDLFRYGPRTEDERDYSLTLCHSMRAPSTLLAFAWYPFARQDDPATWCFVMSAKSVPVRLIDAYYGTTRATYGLTDHREQYVAIQALAFSVDGTRLYAGHDSNLTVFDVSCPGVDVQLYTMPLTHSRRAVRQQKATAGQTGMISSIDVVSNDATGTNELIAVGTFAGTVGIYQMDSTKTLQFEDACMLGWREGDCSFGVSQVCFHPAAPYILFLALRRRNEIRAYDLRYVGARRSFLHPPADVALLAIFSRANSKQATQQRLFFHFGGPTTSCRLVAGDSLGYVNVWDVSLPGENVHEAKLNDDRFFGHILREAESGHRHPAGRWFVTRDAIPSVAYHPFDHLVLVASGSRTWDSTDCISDDACTSSSSSDRSGGSVESPLHDGCIHLYDLSRLVDHVS